MARERATDTGQPQHNLAWNSWMVPAGSKGITYYPMDLDPTTGKIVGQDVNRTHDAWLRDYADWLQQQYEMAPPEEDDFVGSSAINAGWIRKAGFDRYLTYTISPEDTGRSLRRIRDNLWDHLSYAKARRMNPDQIPVVIAVLRTPEDMPTAAEFTLGEFEQEDGDLGRLIRSYRAMHRGMPGTSAPGTFQSQPRTVAWLASEMDRLGQHDLAEAMDRIVHAMTAAATDRNLDRTSGRPPRDQSSA